MASKTRIEDTRGKIDFSQSEEPTLNSEETKTGWFFIDWLVKGINFLWLKLKDLFPLTQATTHNYLPKIDNESKKLVKSNISDDGSTVKIDSPLDLKGNQIKNVAIEVVTSLPTTNNFPGRQVTYEGRSYIWDGSAWKCDADYLEIGGRNLVSNNQSSWNSYWILSSSGDVYTSPTDERISNNDFIIVEPNNSYTVSMYLKDLMKDYQEGTDNRTIGIFMYKEDETYVGYQYGEVSQTRNDFVENKITIPDEVAKIKLGIIARYRPITSGKLFGVTLSELGSTLLVKLEKGNIATDWTPAPEDKADESREINYTSSSTQLPNEQTHLLSVVLNTYGGNITKLFSDLEALGVKDKKEYPITGSSGTILVSTHNITSPSVVAFYKQGKPVELDYTIASNGNISWASSVSFLSSSGVKVVIIG